MMRPPQFGPRTAKFSPLGGSIRPDRDGGFRIGRSMNRVLESFWRGIARYASAQDRASASEVALMLLIPCGWLATPLPALGAPEKPFLISLGALLSPHPH